MSSEVHEVVPTDDLYAMLAEAEQQDTTTGGEDEEDLLQQLRDVNVSDLASGSLPVDHTDVRSLEVVATVDSSDGTRQLVQVDCERSISTQELIDQLLDTCFTSLSKQPDFDRKKVALVAVQGSPDDEQPASPDDRIGSLDEVDETPYCIDEYLEREYGERYYVLETDADPLSAPERLAVPAGTGARHSAPTLATSDTPPKAVTRLQRALQRAKGEAQKTRLSSMRSSFKKSARDRAFEETAKQLHDRMQARKSELSHRRRVANQKAALAVLEQTQKWQQFVRLTEQDEDDEEQEEDEKKAKKKAPKKRGSGLKESASPAKSKSKKSGSSGGGGSSTKKKKPTGDDGGKEKRSRGGTGKSRSSAEKAAAAAGKRAKKPIKKEKKAPSAAKDTPARPAAPLLNVPGAIGTPVLAHKGKKPPRRAPAAAAVSRLHADSNPYEVRATSESWAGTKDSARAFFDEVCVRDVFSAIIAEDADAFKTPEIHSGTSIATAIALIADHHAIAVVDLERQLLGEVTAAMFSVFLVSIFPVQHLEHSPDGQFGVTEDFPVAMMDARKKFHGEPVDKLLCGASADAIAPSTPCRQAVEALLGGVTLVRCAVYKSEEERVSQQDRQECTLAIQAEQLVQHLWRHGRDAEAAGGALAGELERLARAPLADADMFNASDIVRVSVYTMMVDVVGALRDSPSMLVAVMHDDTIVGQFTRHDLAQINVRSSAALALPALEYLVLDDEQREKIWTIDKVVFGDACYLLNIDCRAPYRWRRARLPAYGKWKIGDVKAWLVEACDAMREAGVRPEQLTVTLMPRDTTCNSTATISHYAILPSDTLVVTVDEGGGEATTTVSPRSAKPSVDMRYLRRAISGDLVVVERDCTFAELFEHFMRKTAVDEEEEGEGEEDGKKKDGGGGDATTAGGGEGAVRESELYEVNKKKKAEDEKRKRREELARIRRLGRQAVWVVDSLSSRRVLGVVTPRSLLRWLVLKGSGRHLTTAGEVDDEHLFYGDGVDEEAEEAEEEAATAEAGDENIAVQYKEIEGKKEDTKNVLAKKRESGLQRMQQKIELRRKHSIARILTRSGGGGEKERAGLPNNASARRLPVRRPYFGTDPAEVFRMTGGAPLVTALCERLRAAASAETAAQVWAKGGEEEDEAFERALRERLDAALGEPITAAQLGEWAAADAALAPLCEVATLAGVLRRYLASVGARIWPREVTQSMLALGEMSSYRRRKQALAALLQSQPSHLQALHHEYLGMLAAFAAAVQAADGERRAGEFAERVAARVAEIAGASLASGSSPLSRGSSTPPGVVAELFEMVVASGDVSFLGLQTFTELGGGSKEAEEAAAGGGGGAIDLSNQVMAGWLHKQSEGLVRRWQERYFVLKASYLFYAKSSIGEPVGVLKLSKGDYASDRSEMEKWVDALNVVFEALAEEDDQEGE